MAKTVIKYRIFYTLLRGSLAALSAACGVCKFLTITTKEANLKTAPNMAAALYNMVHGSTVPVEEGASSMGIRTSYLYRITNMHDARANFPALLLHPAMCAFGNISPLEWLNTANGLIAVKPPRGTAKKHFSIHELQTAFADLVKALVAIDLSFNDQTQKEAIGHIQNTLKSLCTLKLSVQKHTNQLELF